MGKMVKKPSNKKAGYRTARKGAFNLENLELRRLMATVNVADFGAIVNDGADDRSGILRAISASNAGDTVLFGSGRFNLSNEITLPGDRTYLGQSGATLAGKGPDGHLLKLQSNNTTVRGLTLDGGGIFVEKPGGGRNTNIVLDSNRFQIDTSGAHRNGITFTSGLNDSKITNNYFTGYNSAFAIYGYNYMGLTIANNEFINVTAGMHIDAFGSSGNLLVEQNYMSGTKGMGMEFQSTASGLVFQDNWYENPSFVSLAGTASGNTMGYSLILDKSSNITIQRNVLIAPLRGSTNDYVRINFEVGGDNTLVTDNFTQGGNHVVAMNDGVGTASVTVRNNRFKDYAQGISNTFPSSTRTLTQSNNGPTVALSSTMEARLAAGQRPGIGAKRYGSSIPQENPTPTPTPVPTPTPAPVQIGEDEAYAYLSDMSYASAVNGWGQVELDESVGEQLASDGRTLTLGNRQYAKGLGVHARSEIRYNLAGKYTQFLSDIGIDAESKGGGSVVFEVWADGALLYSSGRMIGTDAFKAVNVNVAGKQELVLIVTNAGDNNNFDHADWANARLAPVPVAPPPVEPQPEPTPTPSPVEVSTVVHLSDLSWTSAVNGWGPAEINKSVGERLAGDGRVMTIDGKTYQQGLGVHANSEIKYALNGQYSTFSAEIGIDDETKGLGSVVFEVWADGQMLYSSGVMTAAHGYRPITVDVSGKQELTLIVTNGGDKIDHDHANWADAKLTKTVAGTSVSSLPFTIIENGWGPVEINESNGEMLAADGSLMTLNGVVYGQGLGVHAPSTIVVDLDGKYSRFVSDIGLDDEVANSGTAVFEVWVDGELVYRSDVMTGASTTAKVDIDVTGKQQMTMKVITHDAFYYDHANWAGAALVGRT